MSTSKTQPYNMLDNLAVILKKKYPYLTIIHSSRCEFIDIVHYNWVVTIYESHFNSRVGLFPITLNHPEYFQELDKAIHRSY